MKTLQEVYEAIFKKEEKENNNKFTLMNAIEKVTFADKGNDFVHIEKFDLEQQKKSDSYNVRKEFARREWKRLIKEGYVRL